MTLANKKRLNPDVRAASLEELISWEGPEFVRCAFATLLGRSPDESGAEDYCRRLDQGHSKWALLRDLRQSDEGQANDPGIAGLDRAIRRSSWCRLPIIGRLARLYYPYDGDTRAERRYRQLANRVAKLEGGAMEFEAERERDASLLKGVDRKPRTLSPRAQVAFRALS